MGIRIFTSKKIRGQKEPSELKILMANFRSYKENGVLHKSFGRDAPYDRPHAAIAAELWHLHLNAYEDWDVRLLQYSRTSDTCLAYCSGSHDKSAFLLISIFANAHFRANKVTFMMDLAEIAEGFRKMY